MIWIHISQATGLSDRVAIHFVFLCAAGITLVAALLRTWAASYSMKDIVHDTRLHSERVVEDGPYRFTRNPLYLAVILFAIGCSVLASPFGAVIMVIGVFVFDYCLILREEFNMGGDQAGFEDYKKSVPRLFPTFRSPIPPTGRPLNLKAWIMSELTFWCFSLGITAFAITLNAPTFTSD